MVYYRMNRKTCAQSIHQHLINDPTAVLLYSDMTQSVPSNDILNYFLEQDSGKCWTETMNDDRTRYIARQFNDDDVSHDVHFNVTLTNMYDELKSVGINWKDDRLNLKRLFCGHQAIQLAMAFNLASTNSMMNTIHLTKTRTTCSLCHDAIKHLSFSREIDIVLQDAHRVHHFHRGQCSCHDQF
jgi:hypothetical protein